MVEGEGWREAASWRLLCALAYTTSYTGEWAAPSFA